jgi:D-serine dehydratase
MVQSIQKKRPKSGWTKVFFVAGLRLRTVWLSASKAVALRPTLATMKRVAKVGHPALAFVPVGVGVRLGLTAAARLVGPGCWGTLYLYVYCFIVEGVNMPTIFDGNRCVFVGVW